MKTSLGSIFFLQLSFTSLHFTPGQCYHWERNLLQSPRFKEEKVALNPHEFPWIVGVYWTPCGSLGSLCTETSFKCFGTLIDSNTVLTTASCMSMPTEKQGYFTILAGLYSKETFAGTEQIRKPAEIVLHENYFAEADLQQPMGYQNDIALVKLDAPLKLNEFVGVAKLPPSRDFMFPYIAITVEWGNSLILNGPPQLKKYELSPTDYDTCDERFEKGHVPALHICYGMNEKFPLDKGHTGAPLLCGNEKNIICGLATSGYVARFTEPGTSAKFVNIPVFLDWIHQHWTW